ncbi:arabinan endo-1,5-alpha-L-arabinosidase [Nonomuraea sp. NPDC004186]
MWKRALVALLLGAAAVRPEPVPLATPTTPPAAYPNPGRVTGDIGVHDPSVVKRPDGSYLLVHTGDNITIKTSTDRTAWHNAGVVFPGGAPWTTSYTGGSASLWAPDISYRNGRYYLYYSASTFGSRNSAIFLATSTTGASGSWANQGMVISTTSSSNYNAIDPNLVVDAQGRWWLSFGSFWTGIKLIQLDPANGKRLGTSITGLAQRTGTTAIEAPFIFRHGSYYYLWVSFDACCQGASSTYRIMVGRSTSVTGPYVDRNGVAMTSGGGTQVLAGHGSVHGPGHQAVVPDSDAEVLYYHYYADNGAPLLGINLLGYDSAGWPFVY